MKKSDAVEDQLNLHRGLDLPVGDPIQILWEEDKFDSVIRGVIDKKYFLVDAPDYLGERKKFGNDTTLLVRFLDYGVVYKFKSRIIAEQEEPKLILLEYPNSYAKLDLRESERIRVLIPMEMEQAKNRKPVNGAIIDISNTGALLATHDPIKIVIGQKASISLVLPGGDEIKSLQVFVQNVRLRTGKIHIGVRYLEELGGGENLTSIMKGFYNTCLSYYRELSSRYGIGR